MAGLGVGMGVVGVVLYGVRGCTGKAGVLGRGVGVPQWEGEVSSALEAPRHE